MKIVVEFGQTLLRVAKGEVKHENIKIKENIQKNLVPMYPFYLLDSVEKSFRGEAL